MGSKRENHMKLIATTVLLLAAGMASGQTFEGRDLTGDGIADAYYHVEQNLTWLRDGNYYATQGNPPMVSPFSLGQPPTYLQPGEVRLYSRTGEPYAANWVAGLSIGDVDGWRLPHRLVPAGTSDGGPRDRCDLTSCDEHWNWPSELTFLGSVLGGASGPFSNVMDGAYMAITPNRRQLNEYVQLYNPRTVPVDGMGGMVSDETSFIYGYVWAVHDGDVASNHPTVTPVPEPETYALMLLGLAALTCGLRRRTPRQ